MQAPLPVLWSNPADFLRGQLVVERLEVAVTTFFGIGSALDGADFGSHVTF